MSKKLLGALLALALIGFSDSAHAILIKMDFTATGLSGSPPDDPVSGSFTWEAASLSDPIDSLVSVSLTIDGLSYSLAELGFAEPNATDQIIGGTGDGNVGSAPSGTKDFFIRWTRSTETPITFGYSSPGFVGTTTTSTFSEFDISIVQIPEPSALGLFAIGLAGLGILSRRRRRQFKAA